MSEVERIKAETVAISEALLDHQDRAQRMAARLCKQVLPVWLDWMAAEIQAESREGRPEGMPAFLSDVVQAVALFQANVTGNLVGTLEFNTTMTRDQAIGLVLPVIFDHAVRHHAAVKAGLGSGTRVAFERGSELATPDFRDMLRKGGAS